MQTYLSQRDPFGNLDSLEAAGGGLIQVKRQGGFGENVIFIVREGFKGGPDDLSSQL